MRIVHMQIKKVTHPEVSVVTLTLAEGGLATEDGCLSIPCSPGAMAMEALRCFLARSILSAFPEDDRGRD